MAAARKIGREARPPRPQRQMSPLAWILVAGLLVVLAFLYSSLQGGWNLPLAGDWPSGDAQP